LFVRAREDEATKSAPGGWRTDKSVCATPKAFVMLRFLDRSR
jgi:hypothetical protein